MPNNSALKSLTCKTYFMRIYLSKHMQVCYFLLLFLCSISFLLVWLIEIDEKTGLLPGIFQIFEFGISGLMACEVILQIYSQDPCYFCNFYNIIDIPISVLCVLSIALAFNSTLCDKFGDSIYILFVIIRNSLFILRIILVICKPKANPLEVQLIPIAAPFGKKFKFERITYKYRPRMETLFEQDEENDTE